MAPDTRRKGLDYDFPSFSEGLSLRLVDRPDGLDLEAAFPFLFGRAFIEAGLLAPQR